MTYRYVLSALFPLTAFTGYTKYTHLSSKWRQRSRDLSFTTSYLNKTYIMSKDKRYKVCEKEVDVKLKPAAMLFKVFLSI